ncbi:HPr family phosphocarrier protein [Desmospora profundinema]|uniref:Phosphotransferase system HPr-like phosphotransfer protein n=1 Tax=Desmospora profundinema TaxID=1571184 RepID=A0ABU1IH29_9BACL|nr:HPr family phosphocarrier protein [Desmospora profundinema]MDR6224087.1 phosphotransferase system HPr-like phosphotransfer protein [Desmospora profundinema]
MRQTQSMTLLQCLTFDQIIQISRETDSFQGERIYFNQGKITVNAKSFLSVSWLFMKLRPGDSFSLVIEGPLAKQTLDQVITQLLPFVYPLDRKKSHPLEMDELDTHENWGT